MKLLLGVAALATLTAAAPLTKERAQAIMHQRHENMEQIGRSKGPQAFSGLPTNEYVEQNKTFPKGMRGKAQTPKPKNTN